MRKLILVLIAFIAVVTFIRAYDRVHADTGSEIRREAPATGG
jgi:multisubunit Na+/H+ antiporter MnhG subunit